MSHYNRLKIVPIPDQRDLLAVYIDTVIPGCTVELRPFKRVKAGNLWPLPRIKYSSGID